MLLERIVETSNRVAETGKRLAKTALLAGLLSELRPEEAEIGAAFLSGALPEGRIGIGYGAIREIAAEPSAAATLELLDVHRVFEQVAATHGEGSARRKVELLSGLFARATEAEQRFLIRLLLGELRQGALEGVLIEALAVACRLPAARVRRAVMLAGGIAPVTAAALETGERGLAKYEIELFRPVQPMLAQTAADPAEAMAELGQAALEFKLDGARVQAHRRGREVAVFTRGLNDVTAAAPEVVEAVLALPAKDVILDGEVIAVTPSGRPHPFQTTMRRFGRKLNVGAIRDDLPLKPFWFDLLYLDGAPLLDEAQERRFGALVGLSPPEFVIPHRLATDSESATAFFEAALDQGHEGIMAKSPASPYAAGARGQSWLKIKRPRTLDLVILAAEWGSGRRKGWLSNLHLGARDTEKGAFAMLGKTFKGLTDETLAWQTREFLKIEIGRDGHTVYLEPKIVAEIAFNEIQVSPHYASGLALRFARVKRYRPDKSALEADTFETVRRLADFTD